MDYSEFTEEDFIQDESFIDWFKHKDPANDAFWEAWTQSHPEKKEVIQQAWRFLENLHAVDHVFTPEDTDAAWQNIRSSLHPKPVKAPMIVKTHFWRWRNVAAVVATVVAIAAAFWLYRNRESQVTYATAYGETRQVTLPDGSQVMLNANSSVCFQPAWNGEQTREVWLKGEAFFSVVKKQPVERDAKFQVHVDQVVVEVLGTEFNVRARRGQTQIVLNSGKIRLEGESLPQVDSLVMQPGELVQVSASSEALVKRMVNPDHYSSWRKNILIFERTPLAQVAATIEDTYGLKVAFENPEQAKRVITGTIPVDNVDILLLAMVKSFNLKTVREGDRIVFQANHQ